MGGAQGRAESNSTAQYVLQVLNVSMNVNVSGTRSLYNLSAVQDVLSRWGAVQPGSLSGAALWVTSNVTKSSEVGVSVSSPLGRAVAGLRSTSGSNQLVRTRWGWRGLKRQYPRF